MRKLMARIKHWFNSDYDAYYGSNQFGKVPILGWIVLGMAVAVVAHAVLFL